MCTWHVLRPAPAGLRTEAGRKLSPQHTVTQHTSSVTCTAGLHEGIRLLSFRSRYAAVAVAARGHDTSLLLLPSSRSWVDMGKGSSTEARDTPPTLLPLLLPLLLSLDVGVSAPILLTDWKAWRMASGLSLADTWGSCGVELAGARCGSSGRESGNSSSWPARPGCRGGGCRGEGGR